MNKVIGILGAAALGAAVMYMLDPKSGKGRRALIKDKAVSLAHKEGEMIARKGRDLKNRVKGIRPKLGDAITGRSTWTTGQAIAAGTAGAAAAAFGMRRKGAAGAALGAAGLGLVAKSVRDIHGNRAT